jgi:2-polyprenyl-3-methyl-5-hydroxy-6-metoxy-1,4-benzoquinol methylase
MATNKEIIAFLKSKSTKAGFIDTLKIRYRPLICPFDELFKFVTPNAVVGDIGCGSGQFSLLLSKFTPVKKIIGLEISDQLVKNAQELFASEKNPVKHTFRVYNGKTFPDDLQTCDVLFLVDVLHHVPANVQQNFLNALAEKMNPGATFILKDINAASPLVVFNKLHDLVFSGEIGKERSLAQASAMVEKAGFKIIRTFKQTTAVYPHYFLVLQKVPA